MHKILQKLNPSLPMINGGLDTCLMLEHAPYYLYKDGKVTAEQLGIKYSLILQGNGYEKITCKVENLTPCISQAELERLGSVTVKPKNFVGKFYQNNNGEVLFTSSASELEVVK